MANINPFGQAQSADQIRADRLRNKGLCDTCNFDPTQCYEIKNRFGGVIRKRVALTVPGKVYIGICLGCHPSLDPDRKATTDPRPRRGRKKRTNEKGSHTRHQEHEQEERYVDQVVTNIFGDRLIVRTPNRRSGEHNSNLDCSSSPTQSGGRKNCASSDHSSNRENSGPRHHSCQEYSGRRASEEEEEIPSIPDQEYIMCTSVPDLAPASTNNSTPAQCNCSGEGEPMDALAALIAQPKAKVPRKTVRLGLVRAPGNIALVVDELKLSATHDDLSVTTPVTFFQGHESLRQKSQHVNFSAISKSSSGMLNGHDLRGSLTSHLIREPATQDVESSKVSSPPHLVTLREMVEQCTQAGADDGAIDVVTQALIHDNARSMSEDLASFCLTTLWVLARKSDENKRKIIHEDSTFDAIIEAMQIYREQSPQIQTRACGVLWSLSMDPNDRKHVAQGGGCEAILDAMLAHMEKDALHVMALGALKALSFDNIGKPTLRACGALSIVADIMKKHTHNPTIQSDGCVILGNLAVDEVNQFVVPVSENEVEAVFMGILAHPDSLEVHEAACFTLLSLASSADNLELIRRNSMSRVSLELAHQKHPDGVGIHLLTLLSPSLGCF